MTSHIANTVLSTCNLTLILLTSLCDTVERIRTIILEPKLNSTTAQEAQSQPMLAIYSFSVFFFLYSLRDKDKIDEEYICIIMRAF